MNVSSINSYNNTTFGAYKGKHSGKYSRQNNQHKNPIRYAVVGVPVSAAVLAAMFIPGCQPNATKPEATEPTTAYIETYAPENTIPVETQAVLQNKPAANNMVNSIPMDERAREEYHTVKRGDRLTDIVIKYADLDEDYPYEKLIPYFERLKFENPGLIDDKYNVIYIPGKSLRVDGIMPENLVKGNSANNLINVEDETVPEEIEETQPAQITSVDDTVVLNGIEFNFDLGTLDKKMFGKYEGLMYGQFVVVDKKMNDTVEEITYDGINADAPVLNKFVYDEDGKTIEYYDYNNGSLVSITTYAYKPSTREDEVRFFATDSDQYNIIVTQRSLSNNDILTREYKVKDSKTAVTFNFDKATAVIGEKQWTFDAFVCNDNEIGSQKYVAFVDNQEIRFDVHKNCISVEYVDSFGDIISREEYDMKGNLINIE